MIDEIQVENLALIREATLEPAEGLTVLTGETGAGKTALISALELLVGARADREAVREGEPALNVSGRFFSTSGDVTTELVASRRVTADGRSRVSLNGHMASVGELAEAVAPSIDLCGQHEYQQLMQPASHVHLLDAWAGSVVGDAHAAYVQALTGAMDAQAELKRVRQASAASSAKLDEAHFVLQRIDAVDPREGEYEELLAELGKAEHAEALATAANLAHEALAGEHGALDAVTTAATALRESAHFDETLGTYADSLRDVSYVLEDVARDARAYRDEVEFDPATLASQQERMAALQGLLHAYGPRMEDVLERRAEAADLVSIVDDAAQRESDAERAAEEAERELEEAAQMLTHARSKAAPRFADAVTNQMTRLEMGGAELVCELTPLDRDRWTAAGPHAVEFLFRPGAGMQARPLVRIASGGEISRVMLAIKVVLGALDNVDTLVFDEVDAGVGGSTAVALAEVLADLARTHQVIVVTHLAQVAVRGTTHYVVRKTLGSNGVPQTDLYRLSNEERPDEIARMLSGDITEASLVHARELLDAAQD